MVTKVKEELYIPERIKRLKDALLGSVRAVDIDRIKFFTESYKKTEGQMPAVRAAKGLEETLSRMPLRIDDDSLIAGIRAFKKWGGPVYIEAGTAVPSLSLAILKTTTKIPIEKLENEGVKGPGTMTLKHMPKLSDEELKLVTTEILPYWRGKTSGDLIQKRMKELGIPESWLMEVLRAKGIRRISDDTLPTIQGHIVIGTEKVVKMGFKGIARQAAERLAWLDKKDPKYAEKKDFLEAVQISANAVCTWANRFGDLAEEQAANASPERKQELLELAARCRHVPAEPPRTFKEAVQSIYLTQAAILIAYGDGSITCPGRVDQYLYPTYKADIEAGRLTREEAVEWLMEYNIKVSETFNGPNVFTLGGIDKHGDNAVNEVSYLFLEAFRNLKGLRGGLAVRVSDNTPHDWVVKACEVHRYTSGISFFYDPVIIRDLVNYDGYSLEDARDWGNVGCTEVTGCGNNNGYTASAIMFHCALLEMALNEGKWSAVNWKQLGARTPPVSTFKTFEDVKKAFAAQETAAIKEAVEKIELRDRIIAANYPVPLLSSTIIGCVESATDVTAGGAKYTSASLGNQGLATQADSLAAIKWAVYDKKLFTMEELLKHLHNNFVNAEEARQQLLRAPKLGNDDPYVDEIALWVAQNFCDEMKKYKYWQGGVIRGCYISSASQTGEGDLVGATPDGRRAGEPVSNGVSPTNSMEHNGMTANLRSSATISCAPVSDCTSLNISINPDTIRSDENLEKFASTIEAYFAVGGRQVQFTAVSRQTLLDAQKNPQKYPELMVKVSGFSARFTDLSKELQNDVISRTEFNAS